MIIQVLSESFSICKVMNFSLVNVDASFCFIGKTDEECSVVCRSVDVLSSVIERNDGWRGFRIVGELDFDLMGILSQIAAILAEEKIAIFAVSTFNTDYIFVKEEKCRQALEAFVKNGYIVQE